MLNRKDELDNCLSFTWLLDVLHYCYQKNEEKRCCHYLTLKLNKNFVVGIILRNDHAYHDKINYL